MKTAMQDLIEKLNMGIEALEKEGSFLCASGVINSKIIAMSILEKEKEQIIELIRFIRTNDKMGKSIEDLYNEFYNQNK